MQEERLSRSFQQKVKNVVNSIFLWGIDNGHIHGRDQSPVFGIKLEKRREQRPEVLSECEIQILLTKARELKSKWVDIWTVALMTGLRNGELFALRWSDIDFNANKITIDQSYNFETEEFKSTKSGTWRVIPISQQFKSYLMELKKKRQDEFVLPRLKAWINGSQSKALRKFCEEINITSVRFHALRACFATQLLEKGVEPVKVMKICGWKEIKTLQIYLRLSGVSEIGTTDQLDQFL